MMGISSTPPLRRVDLWLCGMSEKLSFSARKLYVGSDYQNLSYRAGAIYQPYLTFPSHSSSGAHISPTLPILCLSCGGYLNQYCEVNNENGTWVCSLCQKNNHSFQRSSDCGNLKETLAQFYPQMSTSCVEYHEPLLNGHYSALTNSDHIRIFAIDTILCPLIDLLPFFQTLLKSLPSTTRVGIVAYGKNINILRLCGGEVDGIVVADVLSGVQETTAAFQHLFAHGEYLTPAHNALSCVQDIIGALSTLVDYSNSNRTVTRTTVSSLLAVLCSFHQHNNDPGIRCLLIAGRSIPLDNGHSLPEDMRLAQYSSLGRDACLRSHVWMDAVVIGMHAVELSSLDSLCSASGGTILGVSYNFTETNLLKTLIHSLQQPTTLFPSASAASTSSSFSNNFSGSSATFEIRTSPGLLIDKITGTLNDSLSETDDRQNVLQELLQDLIGNALLSKYSQSYLMKLIDYQHLENTIRLQQQNNSLPGDKSVDLLYRELLCRNLESENVFCVEVMRFHPDLTYSFIFEPTQELQMERSGILQIIFRSIKPATAIAATAGGGAGGGGGAMKVTQVSTFKLETTEDLYEYQQGLDEDIWISMVTRDLVGELHNSSDPLQLLQTQTSKPSADTLAMMIQGKEGSVNVSPPQLLLFVDLYSLLMLSVDISITKETDNLIKGLVASHWKSDLESLPFQNLLIAQSHQEMIQRKLSRICRALFHLREGPLLYGPSAVASPLLLSHSA
jgi:hypothetical protein